MNGREKELLQVLCRRVGIDPHTGDDLTAIECTACGEKITTFIDGATAMRPQQFSKWAHSGFRAVMCGRCIARLSPVQNEVLRILKTNAPQ